MKKGGYFYILGSKTGVLYIGVTADLERRWYEHKNHLNEGFTSRYNVDRLLYFEETDDITVAIQREKQVKGWLRNRKLDLIKTINPSLNDLADGWFE